LFKVFIYGNFLGTFLSPLIAFTMCWPLITISLAVLCYIVAIISFVWSQVSLATLIGLLNDFYNKTNGDMYDLEKCFEILKPIDTSRLGEVPNYMRSCRTAGIWTYCFLFSPIIIGLIMSPYMIFKYLRRISIFKKYRENFRDLRDFYMSCN